LAHTFILETQRRVKVKVSIKYLERRTKIHLKQLHAKDGTIAWYYGLDALQYSMRFMKTYLCLKTISFVHIFKFWMVLALTCSFGRYAYQELASECTKSETTRSLEEIVSSTSDSSIVMRSPSNSARDILNFSIKALCSIKNLVILIPNLVTTHKWFINWNVLSLSLPVTPNHPFSWRLGHSWVTRPRGSGHPATHRGVPGHPGTSARSPTQVVSLGRHRSDRCLSLVRPVTASAHSFGDFALLVPWMCEYVTNLSPATWTRQCSTRELLKASNGMRE
jgi:hypothetical protein